MPGVGILAPVSLSGYLMNFSDLEGTHEFRFAADGTYREKCTPAHTSKVTVKTGTWRWTRKSPVRATLTLDEDKVLNLTFTTDNHANGSYADRENKLYGFKFVEIEASDAH